MLINMHISSLPMATCRDSLLTLGRMPCTKIKIRNSYQSPPISRHTVVCRAAQEAGMPHREYIYRKKENVIFTLLYLGDSLSD